MSVRDDATPTSNEPSPPIKKGDKHVIAASMSCTVVELYEFFLYGTAALFFFSSRRRHTRFDCDWSSECALPIFRRCRTCVRPYAFGARCAMCTVHTLPLSR